MFKKLLISFLLSLTILFSFAPYLQAKAQTWYNQSFQEWYLKVYDEKVSPSNEIFGERYTAAQVQWIIYSLVTLPLVAESGISKDVITCALTKSLDECGEIIKDFIDKSGTSKVNSAPWYANLGQNPISGVGYISRLIKNISPVSEVKAQGFGFEQGNFSMYLWKISRNIAYFLLVIVVIITAFMIMFRIKLNPQTIISVQSALPKIVIVMVLITFSYAIAGLAIDLVYVIIGLLSTIIVQNNLSILDAQTVFRSLTTDKNVFTLLLQYWILFLGGAMGHVFGGAVIGGLIMFIFAVLSIFILLYFSIKIIFMLLKTFIKINLLIITAPLQILLGAVLPNTGFGPWFRSLISQLLVYPVTGLMFFLAFLFLRQVYPGGNFWTELFVFKVMPKLGMTVWDPPLTVGTGTGDFGGIWLLMLAMSFGIISMIPKTVEMIQSFFAGKPFEGSALGESRKEISGYSRSVLEAYKTGVSAGVIDPTKKNLFNRATQAVAKAAQVGSFVP